MATLPEMSHNAKTGKLTIVIDTSEAAREAAETSKSGKSRILAGTGGFVGVTGTDIKLSINAIIGL